MPKTSFYHVSWVACRDGTVGVEGSVCGGRLFFSPSTVLGLPQAKEADEGDLVAEAVPGVDAIDVVERVVVAAQVDQADQADLAGPVGSAEPG